MRPSGWKNAVISSEKKKKKCINNILSQQDSGIIRELFLQR